MTESEFRQLAVKGFTRIPLVLETFADLDTPLSVYLKLANRPWSYLLESVQGGERFGRYSFIGLPAETRFEVRGHHCAEYRHDRLLQASEHKDPLDFVRSCQARFKAALRPGLPRFCGGLVGFFGYDTVRYIEREAGAYRQTGQPRDAGHPAAVVRAARGGRQPVWKAVPHRLRRPARARRLRQRQGASGGAGREAASKRADSGREADRARCRAARVQRRRFCGGGGARQALHLRRRHHAGGAVAAHQPYLYRLAAVSVPCAAGAQSIALHVLFRHGRDSTWWAPHPRSWCAWRATP